MAKKNTRPNLAARKKADKLAEQKKIAARKAYWEKNKKQILTIAGIVLAAIIALALIIDYAYVPANSVRSFGGKLLDVPQNAIIRELDGEYYIFGNVDTPAGYVADVNPSEVIKDENETSFFFKAEDEGKAVNSAYIVGVKNRGAAEMLEMVAGSFTYDEQTENKQAAIGGHDVHYFFSKGLASEENPDIKIATMTCYVDSVKDSSVLVSLASVEAPLDQLPSEEAMLAEAEAIFAAMKINK